MKLYRDFVKNVSFSNYDMIIIVKNIILVPLSDLGNGDNRLFYLDEIKSILGGGENDIQVYQFLILKELGVQLINHLYEE